MFKVLIFGMVFLPNVGFVIASDANRRPESNDNPNASSDNRWDEVSGVNSLAINKMAAIRSALAFYYTDHNGIFPSKMSALLEYSKESGISDFRLPALQPFHKQTDHVSYFVEPWVKKNSNSCDIATDTGGWGYVKESGRFFINCTHRGPEDTPWCAW